MSRYIDVADSAKMIRGLLKVKFPGVKFSVKSSRYAGGASIDIQWTDGPTQASVQALTSPFAGAGFDGMIDMQYYKSAFLLADGSVVYGKVPESHGVRGRNPELPEGAEEIRFGSDYVHTRREYSDAFIEPIVKEYQETYSDGKFVKFIPSYQGKWGLHGPEIKIEPWQNDVYVKIHRLVEERAG